nr:MAG TPA: hypothetical protein [Bacteriophage sp.]
MKSLSLSGIFTLSVNLPFTFSFELIPFEPRSFQALRLIWL